MKTKLTLILIVLCVVFFCGCVILGFLFYQCKEKGKVLTKLPLPSPTAPASSYKELGLGGAQKRAEAMIYPYYYPYTYKLISYSYKLTGEFPSLPQSLMVYKATPETFDLAKAKALAAKFGFKEEPKVTDDTFTFTEGSTPSVLYREETETKSAPGGAEPGVEPSVPPEIEEFTGRELSISTYGINYADYSVERKEIVYEEGKEEVKPLPPEGVETKEKAQSLAINFLKDKGLLPESYEVETQEPYGAWSVNIYPKFKGYTIQVAGIYLEIGNQGKIDNLSLRKIKYEDFNQYPIKAKDEALKIETVEYKIEKVEVSYRSAYDDKGNEYLQPFYILSGKDSQDQEFSFEIPAVKAEFLEGGGAMPLYKAE